MNSATHLLSEDRPEFERILDEALRADETRQALAGTGGRLNTEQLRTRALAATSTITACAATEYQRYLKVRQQVRESLSSPRGRTGRTQPPSPGAVDGRGTTASAVGGPGAAGTADSAGVPQADGATVGEVLVEGAGAGLAAVITVLTPILAGIAAVILLAIGYSLKVLHEEPGIAAPLRTAGWSFAVLAAAGVLIGAIGMMLTALRNPAADAAESRVNRSPEVAEAREAWCRALLDRGVRPFLHQAITDAVNTDPEHGTVADRADTERPAPSRHPRLGYTRPGFSSPNPADPSEPRRGPDFSSPEFSSPRFSSPDFDTGPETGKDSPNSAPSA